MWMEEQNQDRVNVKRTLQLIDALGPLSPNGAANGDPQADTPEKTIASACPFCMTMLTDGVKSKSLEDRIKQLDVAELLERACDGTSPALPGRGQHQAVVEVPAADPFRAAGHAGGANEGLGTETLTDAR
jgi:hypothetical protein